VLSKSYPPPSTLSCVNDNKSNKSNKNQGFSLVELSIVLLIIGLLVSGVMVGQDMIRAAELRSITTDKDRIQTAVNIFQNKYDALPGDISNATGFWGTMTGGGGCSATGAGATTAVGTQTCNGNGNGMIEPTHMSGMPAINSNIEFVLFWQHLSSSGLIDGRYSGIFNGTWGSDGQELKAKIDNSFWIVSGYFNIPISETWIFEGNHGHILTFYKDENNGLMLNPTETWTIDKKIDDGLPGTGLITTLEGNGINCNNVAASNSIAISATATYNLGYKSKACGIVFNNIW
jgi:prepilin-type N-terminal cleavage/methylation domain-containing protein